MGVYKQGMGSVFHKSQFSLSLFGDLCFFAYLRHLPFLFVYRQTDLLTDRQVDG